MRPDHWVAVVKPGRILFEMAGVDHESAVEAMRLASHKLPVATRVVVREACEGGVTMDIDKVRALSDAELENALKEAKQDLWEPASSCPPASSRTTARSRRRGERSRGS